MWTGDIKGLNYIHIPILHNVFTFASTVHAHRAMLQKLKTQSYIIMRSLFDVHDINAHRADQIRPYLIITNTDTVFVHCQIRSWNTNHWEEEILEAQREGR
jgi:hypothetical protein